VPSGTAHYYFSDHLGSSNVVTNATGTIEEESDFYPFGGERIITDTLSNQNYKFTGKERDTESGLDYFGARYHGWTLGRFSSPDRGPWEFDNPQAFNRYSYTLNNPLRYTDDDGLTPQDRVNAANSFAAQKIQYQWGGKNPASGMDCSGLVYNAFKADPDNTLTGLRTNAAGQAAAFERQGEFSTEISDAQPGDAIFRTDPAGNVAHTGIVVDVRDGKVYFVHEPGAGGHAKKFYVSLKKPNLTPDRKFNGVGRPIEQNVPRTNFSAPQSFWDRAVNFFYGLFPSLRPTTSDSDPEAGVTRNKKFHCLKYRDGTCVK
jgi:RHS repeat-associated protein